MNNNAPLVTIVVISYNHAQYIETCLDSIKKQTYPNIQLIVADDASKDESIAIYNSWLDKNKVTAKKNFHTHNAGLITTLNESIAISDGEYIKCIAADDYFQEDYIQKCMDILLNSKKVAVFTNATAVNDQNEIIEEKYFDIPPFKGQQEFQQHLLKQNIVPGSTLMTKKDIFNTLGKYPERVILEDYYLALQLTKLGYDLSYIDECLIYYRRHNTNITILKCNILEVETIKEKILFDDMGVNKNIINSDIKKQLQQHNKQIIHLSELYSNYKGKNNLLLFKIKNVTLLKYFDYKVYISYIKNFFT